MCIQNTVTNPFSKNSQNDVARRSKKYINIRGNIAVTLKE
jgi:hypothetical protein